METLIALWARPLTRQIATALVGVLLVAIVTRLVRSAAVRYIEDTDARYRTRKVVAFAGYGAAVVVVLSTLSGQLGGFTIAIGAAGAGVAFALQEVVVSIAGWLALSFGSFYKVGDRVQLGGIMGDVIDVGVLRTTIMECGDWVKGDQYNGRIVRVANSFVFKAPVFNYSNDFPFLWDEITVPVKYGSDRALARKIFERVAVEITGPFSEIARGKWMEMVRAYRIEDASVDPAVLLIANDNWLEFTIRYVVDYKRRRSVKSELFTRILDEIDQTGGKVAMASMTVHLVEWPRLDVRLEGPSPQVVPPPSERERDRAHSAPASSDRGPR
ncbi:MAG: mechanosensitive ion channel family protein [Byssovorax sp.]